jgi:cytochrome c551
MQSRIPKFQIPISKLSGCYWFSVFSIILGACSSKPESNNHTISTKFEQYYVQGEQLYIKNCSNCHQKTGTGLGLVYPPLNKSDYLENNFEAVICLMKYGIKGELIINGKNFNKPMPGIPSLTDLETAEIATYIYNTWERKRGIIEVQDVSKIINTCSR